MKRRTLLTLAAAGAVCAAMPSFGRKLKPLRILILGGTRFIGLHMTALAMQRGHTVTFFNRGRTHTDRYPEVERIKGDRNGEIDDDAYGFISADNLTPLQARILLMLGLARGDTPQQLQGLFDRY